MCTQGSHLEVADRSNVYYITMSIVEIVEKRHVSVFTHIDDMGRVIWLSCEK